MKIIAIAVMLGWFGGVANAASSSLIPVMESSVTVRVVSISSSVATDVCTGIEMADRTNITLQNINTTSDVNCSAGISDLAAGHYFILYAGGASISINVRPYSAKNPGPIKIYCKTTGTTATGISVIQGY